MEIFVKICLLRFVYENQKLPFKKKVQFVLTNIVIIVTLLILINLYFHNSFQNNYEYAKATN